MKKLRCLLVLTLVMIISYFIPVNNMSRANAEEYSSIPSMKIKLIYSDYDSMSKIITVPLTFKQDKDALIEIDLTRVNDMNFDFNGGRYYMESPYSGTGHFLLEATNNYGFDVVNYDEVTRADSTAKVLKLKPRSVSAWNYFENFMGITKDNYDKLPITLKLRSYAAYSLDEYNTLTFNSAGVKALLSHPDTPYFLTENYDNGLVYTQGNESNIILQYTRNKNTGKQLLEIYHKDNKSNYTLLHKYEPEDFPIDLSNYVNFGSYPGYECDAIYRKVYNENTRKYEYVAPIYNFGDTDVTLIPHWKHKEEKSALLLSCEALYDEDASIFDGYGFDEISGTRFQHRQAEFDTNKGFVLPTLEDKNTYPDSSTSCMSKFMGWLRYEWNGNRYVNSGEYITEIPAGSEDKDYFIVADWEPICDYTIELNGGNIEASDFQTIQLWDTKNITLPTPTKEGYDFAGWYFMLQGATATGDAYTNLDKDIKWEPNADGTYTYYLSTRIASSSYTGILRPHFTHYINVTYDANGGLCDVSSEIKEKDKTYALNEYPTPTKEGCTFLGWYNGNNKVTSSTTFDSDVTLVAHWKVSPYSIIYDYQYGKAGSKRYPDEYNPGTAINIPSPTRIGSTFIGWQINGQGELVNSIPADFKPTDYGITTTAIPLTAVYTNKNYTISFVGYKDANEYNELEAYLNALTTYNIYDLNYAYSDVYRNLLPTAPSNYNEEDVPTISRDGYNFMGWKVMSATDIDDGSRSLKVGDTVSDIYYENLTGNYVLKAVWSLGNYVITLDANGGTVSKDEILVNASNVNETLYLPTPKKDGCQFDGWYVDEEPITKTYTYNKNITAVAHWSKGTCTVTFDNQGRGTKPSSQTITNGKVTKPEDLTADGYIFGGWYNNKQCSGTAFDFNKTITDDITLYAKWTAIATYNITYNTDNGVINGSYPLTYTTGLIASLPTNVAKPGYTFKGWYDNEDCLGSTITQINYTDTGDKVFYAKWVINTYQVTFDSNSGSEVATQNIKYKNKAAYVTSSKDGYEFVGWFTDSALTRAFDFNTEITANITLYAKFSPKTYTITYEDELNVTNNNPTSYTYGDEFALLNISNNEYSFNGWFNKDTNQRVMGIRKTNKGNLTLAAHWTKKEISKPDVYYTITFYTDGGSKIQPVQVKENDTIFLPTVTKTGYTFIGWYDGDTLVTEDYVYTKDTALVAHFQKIGVYHTITFDTDGGNEIEPVLVEDYAKYKLPVPKKQGFEFIGWYNGNIIITDNYYYTEDITLKAHWKSLKISNTETTQDTTTRVVTPTENQPQEVVTPVSTATEIISNEDSEEYQDTEDNNDGIILTDTNKFAITSNDEDDEQTVSYMGVLDSKAKTVIVPDVIVYNNIEYKVTEVEEEAFKNNKNVTKIIIGKNIEVLNNRICAGCSNLKEITIPKNVVYLGRNLFIQCKKLKTITIKNPKLKAKNINEKAFNGLSKKVVIKVPKGKRVAYKQMFRRKGLSKKVKVK